MLSRPRADHTGRATRRPFSYKGREDMVEKCVGNKGKSRAKTREQKGGGRYVSGTGLSLLQATPGGSRSQTGGPAGKEGQSRGAESAEVWGPGGRRRHAPRPCGL